MDSLLSTKSLSENNAQDCDSKMCENYLLTHKMHVPNTLKQRKSVILEHKQSMINDSTACNASVQSLVCSLCKLIANGMTAVYSTTSELSACAKQNLNDLNNADVLMKKLTNDNTDSRRFISMLNHLSTCEIMNEIDKSGPSGFKWE